MKEMKTYGRIATMATAENDQRKEVKVKVESSWDTELFHVEVIVTLKGDEESILGLMGTNPLIGEELKIILQDGAQQKIEKFVAPSSKGYDEELLEDSPKKKRGRPKKDPVLKMMDEDEENEGEEDDE